MPVGKNSTRICITLKNDDLEILDRLCEEMKTRRSTAASMLLSQTLELTKSISVSLVDFEKKLNSIPK